MKEDLRKKKIALKNERKMVLAVIAGKEAALTSNEVLSFMDQPDDDGSMYTDVDSENRSKMLWEELEVLYAYLPVLKKRLKKLKKESKKIDEKSGSDSPFVEFLCDGPLIK